MCPIVYSSKKKNHVLPFFECPSLLDRWKSIGCSNLQLMWSQTWVVTIGIFQIWSSHRDHRECRRYWIVAFKSKVVRLRISNVVMTLLFWHSLQRWSAEDGEGSLSAIASRGNTRRPSVVQVWFAGRLYSDVDFEMGAVVRVYAPW